MALLNSDSLFEQHAFENDLPVPAVIDTSKHDHIILQARETKQFLGLYDEDGNPLFTTVWGYGVGAGNVSYPGPTLLAYQGHPITVQWQNHLPRDGHLLPVDPTLHIADVERTNPDFVPIVTHVHGGHSASKYDGLPDAWYTQGGGNARHVGTKFTGDTYTYENDQQAATIWYHDHSLGITRLNVYAGLAGFYVLEDQNRLNLEKLGVLPSGSYDLGMAIQDRAFTDDGQLYYPAYQNDVLPGTTDHVGDIVPESFYRANGDNAPSVVPEFFGDTILVNGMAWPNLDVARGDYQFRMLNGSDSRFYVLTLSNPDVSVHLVGVDGGLLPQAKTIMDGDGVQESNEFLLLAPGDRLDLVFDFSKLHAGDTVRLENSGPAYEPFKGVDASGHLLGGVEAATSDDPVASIMQFTVDAKRTAFDASVKNGDVLNPNFIDLAKDADHNGVADSATHVRMLGLFEGTDEFGRIQPTLGTAEPGKLHSDNMTPDGQFGPLLWDAPTTETPLLNSTEQWELFNFTADSHPMHLHLVQYQVVEKRAVDFVDENEDGTPDDTNGDGLITYGSGVRDFTKADIWIGDKLSLRPEEAGWQDTVEIDPHTMMSLVATFDKPGDYAWHCHILSHEDNEMMRPFTVTPDLV